MKHINTFGTWSRINEAEEMAAPMESPAPEAGGQSTGSAAGYTIGGKKYTLNQIVTWVDASITEAMRMARDPEQGLIAEIEKEQEENLEKIGFIKRATFKLAIGAAKALVGFQKNINLLLSSVEAATRAKRAEIAQAVGEQNGERIADIYAEATKTAFSTFWKAAGSVLKAGIKKVVGINQEMKKENPEAMSVEESISNYRRKVRRLFINQLLTLGVSKVNMQKIHAEINNEDGLLRSKGKLDNGLKNSITKEWIDSFFIRMEKIHGPQLDEYIKKTLGADTLKGEKMAAIEQPSGDQSPASTVA